MSFNVSSQAMGYMPYVDAALKDEDFQEFFGEVAQDHQERFGDNELVEVLSNAESVDEVASIVDATVD